MITAIALITLGVVLLLVSLFLICLGMIPRNGAGAGMFTFSLILGGFSILCIVDACHFLIYGTSLGTVQY